MLQGLVRNSKYDDISSWSTGFTAADFERAALRAAAEAQALGPAACAYCGSSDTYQTIKGSYECADCGAPR